MRTKGTVFFSSRRRDVGTDWTFLDRPERVVLYRITQMD